MRMFQDWNALSLLSDPPLLLLALYFGSALRADQLSSLRKGCAEGCALAQTQDSTKRQYNASGLVLELKPQDKPG